MTMTAVKPAPQTLAEVEFRRSKYPGVGLLYNTRTRHCRYMRECSRCPKVREVRDPQDKRNLCIDCFNNMTAEEILKWVA